MPLARWTSRISYVFAVWLFAATILSTICIPEWVMEPYAGGSLTYYQWHFEIQSILSNTLFFSVSTLGLVLGVFITIAGRAYRIPWLEVAGILYIIQYFIFISSVILGVVWVGDYFSFSSFLPMVDFAAVFIYHLTQYLGFVIPTLISLVPVLSFIIGVHFLKKRTEDIDLNAVIFLLLAGLFISPFVSALAYIPFGNSLGRISVEEVRSR
jgi:hypothetical protein